MAACRTSSSEHPPSMRARGLGVGEYCEEERPCLQLRSSTSSSSPSCVNLAAAVHPTAYSPRPRPLRASRDESRKSEHVTIRGLNAATRDMAAIAEAARCAASKWSTKKALASRAPTLYVDFCVSSIIFLISDDSVGGDPPRRYGYRARWYRKWYRTSIACFYHENSTYWRR